MANSLSLFERIDNNAPISAESRPADSSELSELVSRHLGQLFNTHEGNALVDPLYGLPDFNDVAAKYIDVIKNIRREIRTRIERFEPRLDHIRVAHRPNPDLPLNLDFTIHARLLNGHDTRDTWFTLAFDSTGKIHVSH